MDNFATQNNSVTVGYNIFTSVISRYRESCRECGEAGFFYRSQVTGHLLTVSSYRSVNVVRVHCRCSTNADCRPASVISCCHCHY